METNTLTFDFTPRGWTSATNPGKPYGGTWLIPEFRAKSKADMDALAPRLEKMTKPKLADFIRSAGRFCAVGQRKTDLVTHATLVQIDAWYPEVLDSY